MRAGSELCSASPMRSFATRRKTANLYIPSTGRKLHPTPAIPNPEPPIEQFSVIQDVKLNTLNATSQLSTPQFTLFPPDPQPGDIFLNNVTQQFFGFNGTDWIIIQTLSPVLQIVQTIDSSVKSVAGNIANTNTVPTTSNGTLVISQTITPLNANSNLTITFSASGTVSGTQPITTALFQAPNTDAIACSVVTSPVSQYFNPVLSFTLPSGSTNEHTFSVYMGAAAGAVTLNGTALGTPLYGSTLHTVITITEWTPGIGGL